VSGRWLPRLRRIEPPIDHVRIDDRDENGEQDAWENHQGSQVEERGEDDERSGGNDEPPGEAVSAQPDLLARDRPGRSNSEKEVARGLSEGIADGNQEHAETDLKQPRGQRLPRRGRVQHQPLREEKKSENRVLEGAPLPGEGLHPEPAGGDAGQNAENE